MESMESLSSGQFTAFGDDVPEITYESGAKFKGFIENFKKKGRGIFCWPNGASYEGEFVDDKRSGRGVQTWHDSTVYTGEFRDDKRHGDGRITWINGESYNGKFFCDYRHGYGSYQWPDGSSYCGMMYMDQREGYGTFTFSNGVIFQGLYKEDVRFGPGVQTYPDGSQDVGLWQGEKLIKFCTPIDGGFDVHNRSNFEYDEDDYKEYLHEKSSLAPRLHGVQSLLRQQTIKKFMPDDTFDQFSMLFTDNLDRTSLSLNHAAFEEEFFKDRENEENGDDLHDEGILLWNKTPALIKMQHHYYLHRHGKNDISIDTGAIITNYREQFGAVGMLEKKSLEFLLLCLSGDCKGVENMLTQGFVHPDVADARGTTGIISATVNWHMDVITCLLSHGADINKLSDQGCSALSAGFSLYYPSSSFIPNIAETYFTTDASTVLTQDDLNNSAYCDDSKNLDAQLDPAELTVKSSGASSPQDGPDLSEETTNSDATLIINDSSENHDDVSNIQPVVASQSNDVNNNFPKKVDDDGYSTEFESHCSVQNFKIKVSKNLIERCATQLSTNMRVVGALQEGVVRGLALKKAHQQRMEDTLELLIKRGADPNASLAPLPVLFCAVKAADVEMVQRLLMKKASPRIFLSNKKDGLSPLHIAVAMEGEAGVKMTELLLDALADPNARAHEDDSYLNVEPDVDWTLDEVTDETLALLGGRTPLHIVCNREDNNKDSYSIAKILLRHKANMSLLCNGHSPLTLAIASGNEMIINELLAYGADLNQPLTHAVGTALCVAFHTQYENRWPIETRLQIIDRLINAGADILQMVPIGPKRMIGTAVDYAYYVYNLDRRIAHMPYHALTKDEREIFNSRRQLLAHIGAILRNKAMEREHSCSDSVPSAISLGTVKFRTSLVSRKAVFKFCYECGRSVFVRLTVCTRCKLVYFCSKICKTKAWNARHKDECCRTSQSPSMWSTKGHRDRQESPTPSTHPDKRSLDAKDRHSLDRQKQGKRSQVSLKKTPSKSSNGRGKFIVKCPRNPQCDNSHRRTSATLSGRCINGSLKSFVDNYSYV